MARICRFPKSAISARFQPLGKYPPPCTHLTQHPPNGPEGPRVSRLAPEGPRVSRLARQCIAKDPRRTLLPFLLPLPPAAGPFLLPFNLSALPRCAVPCQLGLCPSSSKFAIAHTAFTFPICRCPCQFAAAPVLPSSLSLTPRSAFQLSDFSFSSLSSLRTRRTRRPFLLPLTPAAFSRLRSRTTPGQREFKFIIYPI